MANSVTYGTKGFLDVLLGNKQVKQLWLGTKLIWEKIRKLLVLDDSDRMLCIEYTPETDVTISSFSVFIEDSTVNGWSCILNSAGLCLVTKSGNGTSQETIYSLPARISTVTSLGDPKLLAGRKYYIAFKIEQHNNDNTKFAYYQGTSGNYKIFNISNVSAAQTPDLQTIPAVGDIEHAGRFDSSTKVLTVSPFYGSGCNAQTLFVWKDTNFQIQDALSRNAATLTKYDLRKFRCLVTDEMLNNCSSDMQRLALIYYLIGNTSGNEIAWGAQWNYPNGITVNGVNMFNNGLWTFYRANNNTTKNHITSMTPVTTEPTNPEQFAIYYKGQTTAADGWLDKDHNPITSEMVVAWTGEYWEFASNWQVEFNVVSNSNFSNIFESYGDYNTYNFNDATLYTDKKYYLRINGNEV